MLSNLSEEARSVVEFAKELTNRNFQSFVNSWHLLLSILDHKNKKVEDKIKEAGCEIEVLKLIARKMIFEEQRKMGFSFPTILRFSDDFKKVIEEAKNYSKKIESSKTETEHLFFGVLKVNADILKMLFKIHKIENSLEKLLKSFENHEKIILNIDAIINNLSEEMSKSALNNYNFKCSNKISKFTVNLSQLAQEGKIDPVIGREKEIRRVIQTLSRRTKNNPCLIGEPGVGKTAIAEGLASYLYNGTKVPEKLKNKKVLMLDLALVVAGTKYRGEFEERIKKILDEVVKDTNIILFIDEIHTLIGAGSSEGSLDAANILKPMLAKGELHCIGATTLTEYRKYIEKDSALERRFQKVLVDEPDVETAIKILKGLKSIYEEHHELKITDEAIETAVKSSVRYLTERFLPDKAIDLIDETAAKIKLENCQTEVTSDEIYKVLSSITGIPVDKLSEEDNKKLLNLEKELHKNIISQDEAIKKICKSIRRSQVGLKDPGKPIGSFLFVGPTGTGKTEITKTLAEVLFNDKNNLIRIDMSEYMESNSTTKLIGSPPGYVGFEDSGQLTEKVRVKPYSIILFDEIEKAHPDVLNVLLQVLDDGRLTDSKGKTVDFKNTIIIMTSNLGFSTYKPVKRVGFMASDHIEEDKKDSIMNSVKKRFTPEFLNRLDEIVVFKSLKKKDLRQIVDLLIKDLNKKLESRNICFTITDNVKDQIIKEGYKEEYGARELKRAVSRIVEDKIVDMILEGTLKDDSNVVFDLDNKNNLILQNSVCAG